MDDFAHGRNVTPLPDGLATFTWDTKLKDLLPDDWKLMDAYASQHARIRDTLSHVSGLPGYVNVWASNGKTDDDVHLIKAWHGILSN
jgi:CubicO group peptidase (beta-lactamase class C family)